MNSKGINEKILKAVKETCDDAIIRVFLMDILYDEAEHPGRWWWKDTYKKKIKKYSSDWGEENED